MATNQGFKSFVLDRKKVDPKFLYYWLRKHRRYLEGLGNGATFKEVSKAVVSRIEIELPPLPEQRRIADILDKADALRAKRGAALKKLDGLTQSIFLDMFGDPATNPKGWPTRRVSEYVEAFQGGKSIDSAADDDAVTKNRILKISAVTGMHFLSRESKPVPDSYDPPSSHFVRRGDLLFSRANTTELVGAVAYVEETPPNLLLPDKLWRFVWKHPAAAEPYFVRALFQTPHMRYEIGRRATGTSGSMKNISQGKLMQITTVLPPVAFQREFSNRVKTVEDSAACQRESEREFNRLFASLQHRAFRGEL
jgi:type I restriction enzyme S subunit